MVAATSGITRTSRTGMPISPSRVARNLMLRSWVRPESTSLPITSRQAVGLVAVISLSVTGSPAASGRAVCRRAAPAAAQIERHQQVKPLVGVRGEGERRETGAGDVDAQLLPELADQRLL